MMLSGNLSDWSVGDLLQMLHITKKTASLHIDGADRSGAVYFDEGAVVNAHVSLGGGPKSDAREEVVEAVYVLELLDEGSFEIKNDVPSRMVEPLAVSEALELAGQYLEAERHLDETGLLAARGLRLAQKIEEPIMLSEQVWNAISASIPAFTFPELEARLGRAAAVSTVEQFRDLGILEAVLDDVDQTPQVDLIPPIDAGSGYLVEASENQVDAHLADAFADSWAPPRPEQADEPWVAPAPEEDAGSWTTPSPEPEAGFPPFFATHDDRGHHSDQIVPHDSEEPQPIVANAHDDAIVPSEEQPVNESTERVSPGLTPGASSLSAAIRAAAGAAAGAAAQSDDEAQLLSEAATGGYADDGDSDDARDGSLRRTVKSLVSPSSGSPSGGGLGDLSARFRQAAAADHDD